MRIGIIGGGESGVGAALLAKKVGDDPFVSDHGRIDPAYRQKLIENNVRFEESGHTFDILNQSDLIVKSPGVRDDTPIVLNLVESGLTIISELEYGYRFCHGKIIAVTGSNGKTTTTNLIHHILMTAGIDAIKGGNLGTSLSTLLLEEAHDWYVLEVSSFQLDGIKTFRPQIGIIVNITPDHLDRYDYNFERYADSKFRIASNLSTNERLIYLEDDDAITNRIENVNAQKIPVFTNSLSCESFSITNPFLRGIHNSINASFAIETCRILNIADEVIAKGLETFKNDKHRLQSIVVLNGVEYINDSKATNVDAAFYGLDAMSKPTVWIAGGVDKGNDYNILLDVARKNVKMLICLGKDNEKLIEAFQDLPIQIVETQMMSEAVGLANENTVAGDCVLLSPACASFDLFENFEDRGEQFEKEVWGLLRGRK